MRCDIGSQFLASLNCAYLQEEFYLFCQSQQSVDNALANLEIQEYALRETHHVISSLPFDDKTAIRLGSLWAQMLKLHNVTGAVTLRLRLIRRDMLMANHAAWHWLEIQVPQRCKDVLAGRASGHTWIDKLVMDMRLLPTMTVRTRDIQSSTYIAHGENKTFTYNPSGRSTYFTEAELDAFAIALTGEALRYWLGYDNEFKGDYANGLKARYWLTDKLLNHFGPHVLLLDRTWKAHEFMKTVIMQNPRVKRISKVTLDGMDSLCKSHILKAPSIEHHILDSVGSIANSIIDPNSFISSPSLTTDIALDSTLYASDAAAMVGMRLFLSYLRRMMPLLYDFYPSQRTDNLLLKAHEDRDHLLPFRECSPSRKRVKGPHGIYQGVHLRTQQGMFQEAIYRGITYAAEILECDDFPVVYPSLSRFKAAVEGKPDDYVRKINAYHTPMSQRGPQHAARYWKSSAAWPQIVGEGTIAFDACFEFFQSVDPDDKKKRFPQFGPLVAFLAAGDMSMTECVETPSAMNVGLRIHEVRRGSFNELVKLGLVRATDGPDAVGHAVERLNGFLMQELSLQEKGKMLYGTVMLEHGLCKRGVARRRRLL